MIGSTVGHYRVLARLGEGGMGVVYRAEDLRLGRQVALKFLPADLARDRQALDRLQREARAASALSHPHICTIHDIDEHEEQPFIVMELLEGQTLKERLLERPLPAPESLDVALQLADALDAAHAQGIIHRDLKPANIFVTTRGIAKLLDFGLAKLAEARTGSSDAPTAAAEWVTGAGVTLGTIGYMSPEQVRGEALDARTDLFSLGVVLYEMATGTAPFRGATSGAVLGEILTKVPMAPVRLNPAVPAELERIVNKLLEKDREVRYQSARDLLVDLTRLKREGESGRALALGTTASPRVQSLAVLPFTNMSADKENEYFCDGLSEELINALTHVRELRVAARTSAFAFKGKEIDIREVGEKLNVGAILEGSVRKSGQRLRITAQLISVGDGYHLWSSRYDREMKDIFDIQDEISLTIVDHLKLNLLKGEREKILKRHTEDHEAYEAYLKGLYFWRRRYERGLQKSLQYFQQAAERDPGYALPQVGIADAYGILGVYGFLSPDQAYPRARAAANKALEIDAELGEVHASLGWIAMWYDRDFQASERHFQKAIRIRPDYPEAHMWYGNLLFCTGRFDEAVREMRRGKELEPLEPAPPTHVAWALYFARRFDESLEELNEVIQSDPEFSLSYLWQSANLIAKGMYGEAIAAIRKFDELTAGAVIGVSLMGAAYGLAGMQEEALSVLRRLDELSKERYVGPLYRALVWTGLGAKDKALEYLEEAYVGRESAMAFLGVWPVLDALRSEPRFTGLLKKMNLEP
jgi:eukaryotic-like serine/threonine-protein kinase